MLLLSAFVLLVTLVLHVGTTVLALRRCAWSRPGASAIPEGRSDLLPAVSLIMPVTLLEEPEKRALQSSLGLAYPHYEILFCAPGEGDPAVDHVRGLLADNPHLPATLLIGRDRVSFNPKLDNIEKGWAAARHPWVIVVDSNVMMPPDFIERMFAHWREGTGLVTSPPVGAAPESFAADIECGFLNTYQARWLLAADTLGAGFAHGKAMLLRRALLEPHGGLRALAFEVAEDMAATKFVRRRRLAVQVVDRPFFQPLGRRRLAQVWHRHLRWAQLRRQSVPALFATEIVTTAWLPALAAAHLAASVGSSAVAGAAAAIAVMHAAEAVLARAAGWPLSLRSPLAWLARDAMIPAIWALAWFRNHYRWRGNAVDMNIESDAR